jgi:hypothetical protein
MANSSTGSCSMYFLAQVNGVDMNSPTNQSLFLITVLKKYDYVFAENGLIAYKSGISIGCQVWQNLLFWLCIHQNKKQNTRMDNYDKHL